MTVCDVFPVRNVRFAMNDGVPRHWHGGQRAVTIFFNNLSIFFPPGERFFVAAVSEHRRFVEDARLLAEVRAFCGQEGIHSREHVRYNRMLEAQGYPAESMEDRIASILRILTRVLPPRVRLAATCALEHFTATLAHSVLSDPGLLEGAHPVMAALWRWHAAEENEHKAVAYDVYQQVGGNYPERVAVMLAATVIFWVLVVEQQVELMRADRSLSSLREWRSLWRFLWIEPGGLRAMWRLYLDYYRPGFHPWQLDNRDLLEKWKQEYEGSATYQVA
jgi:predicted metal-dependent hydrolase